MFELRKLPYETNAFGDFLTPTTFEYHYGKHHQTYVTNLNNLIKGGEFENAELYDIIKKSNGGLFNNAAQVYNHDFYWDCISPSKTDISADLSAAINAEFGSLQGFKEKFIQAATTLFGAGWCWLVYNLTTKKLEIVQTSNAATPITDDKVPLLVVDVWEHAYYLKFQNRRPDYIKEFWNVVNWDEAAARFAAKK